MTDLLTDMYSEGDFFEHFGRKGMKWGVRKASSNPAHTSADAARYNKIKTRIKKNGVDNLSNDDLAKLNKRNQLLSEYKKANPSKFKKGAETTEKTLKVLKTAGTVISLGAGAVAIAKSPTAKEGALAVAKLLKGL